jgi:protocatechuate 3,4-dioxygenase beta subunit
MIPVVGDWNGDGKDTVGVFNPSTGFWYLRNSNTPGAPDVTPFAYGGANWTPVVGDWNADGTDTVGVVNPANETWYLKNSNAAGGPDVTPFNYGGPGWTPLAGDWTGSTSTTVALTPALDEGPLSDNFSDIALNHSDLTAGTTRSSVVDGVPLTLTLDFSRVSGSTVTPLTGARIDVWQADASGTYSDDASAGTAGESWLRGYQMTDANGSVTFTTIYPGWYSGRTPHINLKVRLFSGSAVTYEFTTELYLDDTTTNAVYANSPYNTHGTRDTTNATDKLYNTPAADGTAAGTKTTISLTPASGGGYSGTFNAYLRVG